MNRSPIGVIILFGPPGAGKGTQARELSKYLGIPHISMGDILRSNITAGNLLGRGVKEILDRGELVPDSAVKDMLQVRLLNADTSQGYILEGFPRTLEQAHWLSMTLTSFSNDLRIVAVAIEMTRSQLVRRIAGRKHCPFCYMTFNIYGNRPQKDGFCDRDMTPLVQRPDDCEEILDKRLDIYDRLTMPVFEHFRAEGVLAKVAGEGPIMSITNEIINCIEARLNAVSKQFGCDTYSP